MKADEVCNILPIVRSLPKSVQLICSPHGLIRRELGTPVFIIATSTFRQGVVPTWGTSKRYPKPPKTEREASAQIATMVIVGLQQFLRKEEALFNHIRPDSTIWLVEPIQHGLILS
jgi:hypothetical protein